MDISGNRNNVIYHCKSSIYRDRRGSIWHPAPSYEKLLFTLHLPACPWTIKRSAPPLVQVERGQHLVAGSDGDARFDHRTLLHCGKPGRISAAVFPFQRPGRSFAARIPPGLPQMRKTPRPHNRLPALPVHFRMFVIISLRFVFHLRGEHGAVPHVVPIDDRVVVGKILRVFIVDEQTAHLVCRYRHTGVSGSSCYPRPALPGTE